MKRSVTVKVPGACGELLQGVINNQNILIGCPINQYTYLTLTRDDSINGIHINERKKKTKIAIKNTFDHYGIDTCGLSVEITSELPVGKGMASSTADIVAAIIATMTLLNKTIDLNLVTAIATSIEPTDPCYLNCIVAFDHIKGKVIKRLGTIDPLPLIIFDSGGTINTLEFNSTKDLSVLKKAKESKIKRGFQLITNGLNKSNNQLIGQGMTLSAIAHQKILHKSKLNELITYAKTHQDIVGINVAHSGTIIGVILKNKHSRKQLKKTIQQKFPSYQYLMDTTIHNGGYEIIEVR